MSRPNRYGALTERVGAIKRILSIKGLPFSRRKASDDSVFFDQYPGQWSAETAPREALVANADWSASPNPGLLEGGFDYYPRAEEEWAGQRQEQRSFARDVNGQRVPRFCLTDSWEDLPGTLAGMAAFSTALETGVALATSFSASSAVSAQFDGGEDLSVQAAPVQAHKSTAGTSSEDHFKAFTSLNCDDNGRISAGSSTASFEFSPCTSGRTSVSSLPSELPVNPSDDISAVSRTVSSNSSDNAPPLFVGVLMDKGKTPIRTVEEEHRAAPDETRTGTCSADASREAVALESRCHSTVGKGIDAEEEVHNETHLFSQLDLDENFRLSLGDIHHSYTDEEEHVPVPRRVLRVVNVS